MTVPALISLSVPWSVKKIAELNITVKVVVFILRSSRISMLVCKKKKVQVISSLHSNKTLTQL